MLEEKLEQLSKAKEEIFKFFDIDGHHHGDWLPIEDHLDAKWIITRGNEILYYEGDGEYGYDYVTPSGEKDGYRLFYVRDNGDKFWAVFKNDNLKK